jgi:hypothetical protein
MIRHTVREGECISSIAADYGLFRDTVEAENASLKRVRGSLNMLVPGDVVVVPERRRRTETVVSGASYRFRRKGVPEIFCIRFVDANDSPRAGLGYRLSVDGAAPLTGTTDARGMVRRYVSPNAQRVELALTAPDGRVERYTFALARLPPPDTIAGAQARLKSLGFYHGEQTGALDDGTRLALRAFQASHNVASSGELDSGTVDALKREYEAR